MGEGACFNSGSGSQGGQLKIDMTDATAPPPRLGRPPLGGNTWSRLSSRQPFGAKPRLGSKGDLLPASGGNLPFCAFMLVLLRPLISFKFCCFYITQNTHNPFYEN